MKSTLLQFIIHILCIRLNLTEHLFNGLHEIETPKKNSKEELFHKKKLRISIREGKWDELFVVFGNSLVIATILKLFVLVS